MKYLKIIKLMKELFFNLDNLADLYSENRISSVKYVDDKNFLYDKYITELYKLWRN